MSPKSAGSEAFQERISVSINAGFSHTGLKGLKTFPLSIRTILKQHPRKWNSESWKVADTYGSFAFGYLHTGKLPDQAALILHNDVLPFYRQLGIKVAAILTDNGREYCGRATHHHYEIYLELSDIEHRRAKPASPQTKGFVERFNRTVVDEFFRIAFREKCYPDLPSLQTDLDGWLKHYNYECPHHGYRNMVKRPFETMITSKNNISTVSKED